VNQQPPAVDDVRSALRLCRPELAALDIAPMSEGWDFWTFTAGDYVLRIARSIGSWLGDDDLTAMAKLELHKRLLPELAPTLPAPVPLPEFVCEDGPAGMPFEGYRKVAGVPVRDLQRPLAPDFGAALGRFLKALHTFPAERAAALGVRVFDGSRAREDRSRLYESVIRRVFPLLGCETRGYTEQRFEAYLNDAANFEFEPKLLHHDIDRQNVLVDPETGELAGVIDFGDAVVGNPAIDLWMALIDFPALGIEGQLSAFLAAYGIADADLARARTEVEFVDFLWPVHDTLHGLDVGDDGFVEEGITGLNARVPAGFRCA
jgi:aminoglycoside phosphotransferase (APT) family kinase protein